MFFHLNGVYHFLVSNIGNIPFAGEEVEVDLDESNYKSKPKQGEYDDNRNNKEDEPESPGGWDVIDLDFLPMTPQVGGVGGDFLAFTDNSQESLGYGGSPSFGMNTDQNDSSLDTLSMDQNSLETLSMDPSTSTTLSVLEESSNPGKCLDDYIKIMDIDDEDSSPPGPLTPPPSVDTSWSEELSTISPTDLQRLMTPKNDVTFIWAQPSAIHTSREGEGATKYICIKNEAQDSSRNTLLIKKLTKEDPANRPTYFCKHGGCNKSYLHKSSLGGHVSTFC